MAHLERVWKFDYFHTGARLQWDYELDLAESGLLNFRCVTDGTSSGWHHGWTMTRDNPVEITCRFHYQGERGPFLHNVLFRAKRHDTFAATNSYPVVMIRKEVLTGVNTAPPAPLHPPPVLHAPPPPPPPLAAPPPLTTEPAAAPSQTTESAAPSTETPTVTEEGWLCF